MNVKVEEKMKGLDMLKNNEKSEIYNLPGERDARYYNRILSKLNERQQKWNISV